MEPMSTTPTLSGPAASVEADRPRFPEKARPERASPRRRRSRLTFLVGLGILLLVVSLVGASWALQSPGGGNATSPGAEAPAATAPTSTLPEITAFGHVDVNAGIVTRYALQPARVVKVGVEENQPVKAGAVLVELDSRLARTQLEEAQADLNAAVLQQKQAALLADEQQAKIKAQQEAINAKEHEISAARNKLEQARRLLRSELASAEDVRSGEELIKGLEAGKRAEEAKLELLEKVDPQLEVQRAEQLVKAKQAVVARAQLAVDECQIKAPSDGTVLRMLVSEGEIVSTFSQVPMFYFCPEGRRIIRAEIDQEFAGHVAVGQKATIQDDMRAGPYWTGRVARVSDWYAHRRSILLEPLQMNDIRTLEAIIELDEPAPPLRIGQRMRVTLQ